MNRPRILYLAHRIPYPPNKGDKIRSFREMAYLAERCDVWCAFFVDDPDDWQYVTKLRAMCREVAAIPLSPRWAKMRAMVGFAGGRTLSEGYFDNPRMRRVVKQWANTVGFDATLVFSSGMAGYAELVQGGRKVLDFCDWDSLKFEAYGRSAGRFSGAIWRGESRRLRRREMTWLNVFDSGVVVTEEEARAVPGEVASDRLHVVGNGVDVGDMPRVAASETGPVVGFVGQMDYPPNVEAVTWFADAVWPAVVEAMPEAVFRIVGRSPTREVLRLAERRGIEITGGVDCVRSELEQFAVSVAPLRIGRGIQNKVLEAMAACRPVVLTEAAASGIGGVDGEHYYMADNAATLAAKVIGLLNDASQRDRLGRAGRAFVADRFDWSREMAKLEALLVGKSPLDVDRESRSLVSVCS